MLLIPLHFWEVKLHHNVKFAIVSDLDELEWVMVLADVLDESHKVIVILLALSIIVKSAPESIAIELGVCQLLILQFIFVVNEYVTE